MNFRELTEQYLIGEPLTGDEKKALAVHRQAEEGGVALKIVVCDKARDVIQAQVHAQGPQDGDIKSFNITGRGRGEVVTIPIHATEERAKNLLAKLWVLLERRGRLGRQEERFSRAHLQQGHRGPHDNESCPGEAATGGRFAHGIPSPMDSSATNPNTPGDRFFSAARESAPMAARLMEARRYYARLAANDATATWSRRHPHAGSARLAGVEVPRAVSALARLQRMVVPPPTAAETRRILGYRRRRNAAKVLADLGTEEPFAAAELAALRQLAIAPPPARRPTHGRRTRATTAVGGAQAEEAPQQPQTSQQRRALKALAPFNSPGRISREATTLVVSAAPVLVFSAVAAAGLPAPAAEVVRGLVIPGVLHCLRLLRPSGGEAEMEAVVSPATDYGHVCDDITMCSSDAAGSDDGDDACLAAGDENSDGHGGVDWKEGQSVGVDAASTGGSAATPSPHTGAGDGSGAAVLISGTTSSGDSGTVLTGSGAGLTDVGREMSLIVGAVDHDTGEGGAKEVTMAVGEGQVVGHAASLAARGDVTPTVGAMKIIKGVDAASTGGSAATPSPDNGAGDGSGAAVLISGTTSSGDSGTVLTGSGAGGSSDVGREMSLMVGTVETSMKDLVQLMLLLAFWSFKVWITGVVLLLLVLLLLLLLLLPLLLPEWLWAWFRRPSSPTPNEGVRARLRAGEQPRSLGSARAAPLNTVEEGQADVSEVDGENSDGPVQSRELVLAAPQQATFAMAFLGGINTSGNSASVSPALRQLPGIRDVIVVLPLAVEPRLCLWPAPPPRSPERLLALRAAALAVFRGRARARALSVPDPIAHDGGGSVSASTCHTPAAATDDSGEAPSDDGAAPATAAAAAAADDTGAASSNASGNACSDAPGIAEAADDDAADVMSNRVPLWLQTEKTWSPRCHKGLARFDVTEATRATSLIFEICDMVGARTETAALALMTLGVVMENKFFLRNALQAAFAGDASVKASLNEDELLLVTDEDYVRGSLSDREVVLLVASCVFDALKRKAFAFDSHHKEAVFAMLVTKMMQDKLQANEDFCRVFTCLASLQQQIQDEVVPVGAWWGGPMDFVESFTRAPLIRDTLTDDAQERIIRVADSVIRSAVLDGIMLYMRPSKVASIAFEGASRAFAISAKFFLSTGTFGGIHPLVSLACVADHAAFAGDVGPMVGAGSKAEVHDFSLRVPSLRTEVDDLTGGRGLVVKRLRKTAGVAAKIAFKREIRNMKRLKKARKRATSIFDIVEPVSLGPQRLVIVLEKADTDLLTLLTTPERIAHQSNAELMGLLGAVAKGINFLRANGWAEGYLTPRKVLVNFGAYPRWLINGFSAEIGRDDLTGSIGEYLAPEALGHMTGNVDESVLLHPASSDAYVLGVVAYQLLTRQPHSPFSEQTLHQALEAKTSPSRLDAMLGPKLFQPPESLRHPEHAKNILAGVMFPCPLGRLNTEDLVEHGFLSAAGLWASQPAQGQQQQQPVDAVSAATLDKLKTVEARLLESLDKMKYVPSWMASCVEADGGPLSGGGEGRMGGDAGVEECTQPREGEQGKGRRREHGQGQRVQQPDHSRHPVATAPAAATAKFQGSPGTEATTAAAAGQQVQSGQ
eukprot:g13872.t1